MISASRFCSVALVLCVVVLGPVVAAADQGGIIVREGFYTEITDTESISFAIYSFRISGDGSKVVYFGWDGANHQLWVVDADGQNNTLIDTSFQWLSLYNGLYDISDDGSTIAYMRLTSGADPTPELTAYDVATMAKTNLLKQLPVSDYGTPVMWNLDPADNKPLFRLSGDGSKVFFLNHFGPIWGPPWSGRTYYRVNTDGSGFADIFEARELPTITGIGADSTSLIPWGGELAVNYTGSTLALTTAGSSGDTDLVVMDGDGNNGTVIQDIRGGSFYGPTMAADGTIVYARGGTGVPATTGTFVTTSTLPQSPVQVDPASGYWAVYPHIASDASSVVYNFDLGGGSSPSIRWAKADGTQRLPLTIRVIEQNTTIAMVAAGGATAFTVGSTSRLGYSEIVRIDIGGTPAIGHPRVTAVSGSPDMSIGLNDGPYTFYYTTTGSNLREMYSFPFTDDDPGELFFGGFCCFNDLGYLYDDGATNGDVVASDNIFTDDWVELTLAPPTGVEDFYVRAGVATDNGTAAFADYLCTFGEDYGLIFKDGFESGNTSAWSAAVP